MFPSQSVAQSANRVRVIARLVASVGVPNANGENGECVVASLSPVRRCDAAIRCVLSVKSVEKVAAIRRKSVVGRDGEGWMGWDGSEAGLFWKGGGKRSGLPDTRRRPCEAPRWPGGGVLLAETTIEIKKKKKKKIAET
jgi:hypothetical protein